MKIVEPFSKKRLPAFIQEERNICSSQVNIDFRIFSKKLKYYQPNLALVKESLEATRYYIEEYL